MAPPVRISPKYPESESAPPPNPNPNPNPTATDFAMQPKLTATDCKRISELQAENSLVGQQLEKQLEAAERELEEVRELFGQEADHCLNLKKPELMKMDH